MYCTQCGKKLSPDDKFCERCGKPINKDIQKSEPAKATVKKNKGKKAGIIAGSTAGSIIAVAVLAFFLLNFFNFPILHFLGFEDDLWQYDKKIKKPITALSADQDITLGEIETHGVAVEVPAKTFDSNTSVTLSHPEKKPQVDHYAFEPLGAPITIESTGQQKRLNKPVKVTLSIDDLGRDRSGASYIAVLNERNEWDYIAPDKIDLKKKLVTFETHHLGTYGFVNLKKEKLVQEFSRQRSVRQWAEQSLEPEAAQARDEIVREILQDRLKISGTPALEALIKLVTDECPASKLAKALVDNDAARFTKDVVESAKRNIPKTVEPMILKEALEKTAAQPWAADITDAVAEILKEGNLTQATIKILDEVASEFIVDKVEKEWVDLADRKINLWNNPEIEKSYQVFKGGTEKEASLWGYKVKAGNFEELWGQMRGVAEEVVNKEIASYARANNKKIEDILVEVKDKIKQDAKLNLKKQFEERIKKEAEILRIENQNIKITDLLDKKGLLKTEASNPSFRAEDDLGLLINRIYVTIEEIKRDTGRFEIIFEEDKAAEIEKYDPETTIEAQELVDLVYIRYDKGEEAYRQAVEQKNLVKEEVAVVAEEDVIIEVANMSLDGFWQRESGLVIEIVGENGYFYSFSPTWQEYADKGLVSKGAPKIRKIVKVDDNKWTCDNLFYHTIGDNSVVFWSNWANIVMSEDGKSITIENETTSPLSGKTSTSTSIYYRITEEQSLQKPEVPKKETEDTDTGEQEIEVANMSLDGFWQEESGLVVEIVGKNGYFQSFSPAWQKLADKGLVSKGALKIRKIVKVGDNKWTCDNLWRHTVGDNSVVYWSNWANIVMSEDGKSITMVTEGTSPLSGKTSTGTYIYHRTTEEQSSQKPEVQKKKTEDTNAEEQKIEVANMSLDGFWQRESGLVIVIVGKNGYFYTYDSIWQKYADKDLVSKGVPKIRKIVKVDDNKWTCDNLWQHTIGDNSVVYWSNWTNIVMSDDGKSITIETEATSPLNGKTSTETNIYYRITEEQSLQKPEVPKKETEDKINLNGRWLTKAGTGVEITGTVGVFYSLEGWQDFIDAGLVKLGDLKIKDIKQIGDKKWKCLELWWFTDSNNKPYSVEWSDDGIITMSDDGKSITIESSSTSPINGKKRTGKITYYRQ